MHFAERLSRAVRSSDLELKPFVTDLDYVIASGMAANEQSFGALAFWGKHLHDFDKLQQLQSKLVKVMVARSRAKRSRAPVDEVGRCAEAALRWWIDDQCGTCHGVMYQAVGQLRSTLVCPACLGSGKKAEPRMQDVGVEWPEAQWRFVFNQTVNYLDNELGYFLRAAAGKVIK